MFGILYTVFTYIFGVGRNDKHFSVYLLLGIVLWNFFVEVTMVSMTSIVDRGDLLRKINFPKYIIVVAGSVSALINLLINLVVVAVFMILNHVPITWWIFAFPLYLGQLFMFALAIGFFLAAAYVKYRDLSHIWEVIMQAAIYATPVIYPFYLIPTKYAPYIFLNPVAQMIQDMRYSAGLTLSKPMRPIEFMHHGLWLVPFIITAITVFVATKYFRSQSKEFAENI